MAAAVARSREVALNNDNAVPSREEVFACYQQLRAISKRHNDKLTQLISTGSLLQQARRLGLARGKTLLLEDMDELAYVFDLAIHTAPPSRTRVIDRYAQAAKFAPGSDEARVLEAMQAAQFAILEVVRRHETAGLIMLDVYRDIEVWLVDIGLEASLRDGEILATRLYTPDRFSITAGVCIPFDLDILDSALERMPQRLLKRDRSVIDDRRFAEAIYRGALDAGLMDKLTFLDLSAA